ncbi:MAG: HAMP domain-containing protein [Armatimonadetes bacterium]|nr:HAMP domain-containing protein [Armatimonadota bacterium]
MSTRLFLLALPLVVAFVVFNRVVSVPLQERILESQLEERGRAITEQLAILAAHALASYNEWVLPSLVDSLRDQEDVEYVVILDAEGRVLAHHDPDQVGSLEGAAESDDGGDSSSLQPGEILTISRPIQLGSERLGTVRIGLSTASTYQALAASCATIDWFTGLLSLGAVLSMALVAQGFARPLLRMAAAARRAAIAPDEALHLDIRRQDEVGAMAEAFRHMSDRLGRMTEKERQARLRLQERVARLMQCAERVAQGDLEVSAATGGDYQMGRVESGFNAMVASLRKTQQAEQRSIDELEANRRRLEEANRKLRELDRLKGDFLNTVSHELRTPLTSIRAFAEILLDSQDTEDEEGAREFLEIIDGESERLTRLINNLLDVCRIERGDTVWETQELELAEAVQSSANAVRSLLSQKRLELEIRVAPGMRLLAARDPLVQVFTNLLSNAIKFTPEGGRITVLARREGELLEVDVEDTGVGIAPEEHAQVFECFRQTDSRGSTSGSSGLGLAIVRSIVDSHGGTMRLRSQPGQGSCFTVCLKALPQPMPC